jgi:hypothetical protein
MRAEKVITALLNGSAAVVALLADRVYPSQVPQGKPLPAAVVDHISSNELTTIDANAAYGLVRSRIQVTVLANSYPAQKALLEEVRLACNYQRGVIAGVRVVSVIRDTVGPDMRDDDRGVFYQSVDFQVTHQEP